MAALNSAKRVTNGLMDGGFKSTVRVLDFPLNLASDVTMGTATDTINLGTLPGGLYVVGGSIQQVTAGTGTGTLVLSIGATTISGTLASTATAGTFAATVPAAIPLVVPAAGAEIVLTGATAIRTDGVVKVTLMVAEGDRTPDVPTVAARDVG